MKKADIILAVIVGIFSVMLVEGLTELTGGLEEPMGVAPPKAGKSTLNSSKESEVRTTMGEISQIGKPTRKP